MSIKKRNVTLVIGVSEKSERYSYKAVEALQKNGKNVIAFGLKEAKIKNVSIITTLELFNKKIHTISIYLNPKRQEEYYDYILNLKPKRVIFNPGTENNFFENELKKNNIIVENACTLVLLSTNQY